MSDTPSQFATKNKAMFDACKASRDQVVRTWMMQFVIYILPNTRGPGYQMPASTDYLATGRLRGGYQWTEGDAPSTASRMDGGPYDESGGGSSTRDRLLDELQTFQMAGVISLWNDVGYGWLVHEGRGRHRSPDKWISVAEIQSARFMAQAQASVASRA